MSAARVKKKWKGGDEKQHAAKKSKSGELNIWSYLPHLVVERIYSFLDPYDRYNMALVCKAWAEGYARSSLWKKLELTLTPDAVRMYPSLTFIEKKLQMIQELEITYIPKDDFTFSTSEAINFLLSVMELLKHGNVRTFIFKGFTEECLDWSTRKTVAESITTFICSQPCLEYIEFYNLCVHTIDVVNILKSSLRNLVSLKHLTLSNFDSSYIPNSYSKFTWLFFLLAFEEFETNYLWLQSTRFDAYFGASNLLIASAGTGRLRVLKLHCFDQVFHNFHERIYFLTCWTTLKTICPDMTVQMNIRAHNAQRNKDLISMIDVYLNPYIPLTVLNFSMCGRPSQKLKIGTLFSAILGSRATTLLEKVRINWHCHTTITKTKSLLDFVRLCSNLRELSLHLCCGVKNLERILDSWVLDRPQSLEKMNFIFCCVVDSNVKDYYVKMNEKYVPRLNSKGLNLSITVVNRDHPRNVNGYCKHNPHFCDYCA